MREKVLEDFCGSLLVFSELFEILGATNLGKGSDCLYTDERFFITNTLHKRDP
jgi:hypothetical protein